MLVADEIKWELRYERLKSFLGSSFRSFVAFVTKRRSAVPVDEFERGRAEERKNIVRWLRVAYQLNENAWGFAASIEAGRHNDCYSEPVGVTVNGRRPMSAAEYDLLYDAYSRSQRGPDGIVIGRLDALLALRDEELRRTSRRMMGEWRVTNGDDNEAER